MQGVLTGVSAVYLAFAFLLNDTFGRTVLPVGRPARGRSRPVVHPQNCNRPRRGRGL